MSIDETVLLEPEEREAKSVLTSPSGGTSYRFARQRTPLVALEKLQITPDSNGRTFTVCMIFIIAG